MYLKTVRLHGFKSFADRTTLTFEPGVTAVVGPNGSGKSNVVDALAWVLGSASPRSLRSQTMADVVFAGAGAPGRRRQAMGRAQVELVLDDTEGRLDLGVAEVSISRTTYTSGDSSYAINGQECRLLDVQELLSDAGIGRTHHLLVGQGQLTGLLDARPGERRTLIEEAAGVRKHRQRRDRSLRKLDHVAGHLARLEDLQGELRRRMRPLKRQADAAARHERVRAELVEVRRSRGARILRRVRSELRSSAALSAALATDAERVRVAKERAAGEEARLAAQVRGHGVAGDAAGRRQLRLARTLARAESLQQHAWHLRAARRDASRRLPSEEAQLQRLRARREELTARRRDAERAHATGDEGLRAAAGRRQAAEGEVQRRREVLSELERGAQRRRRQLLRLAERRATLDEAVRQAETSRADAAADLEELRGRLRQLQTEPPPLQATWHRAQATHQAAAARVRALQDDRASKAARLSTDEARVAELDRRCAALLGRVETLRESARALQDGAQAVLRSGLAGVVGPLSDRLRVEPGWERAVAAALGPVAVALVVDDADTAARALDAAQGLSVAALPLTPQASDPDASGPDGSGAPVDDASLEVDGHPPLARRLALGAGPLRSALVRALAGCHTADDHADAQEAARRHPQLIWVTPDGRLTGARGWSTHAEAGAGLVAAAAADRTGRQLEEARRALGAAQAERDRARGDLERAGQAVADALEELRTAAEDERERGRALSEVHRQVERVAAEVTQVEDRIARAVAQAVDARRELSDLQGEWGDGQEPPGGEDDPDGPDRRDRCERELAEAVESLASARERQAVVTEGQRTLAAQVEQLRARCAEVDDDLREAEERARRARAAEGSRAGALARLDALDPVLQRAVQAATAAVTAAEAQREHLDRQRGQAEDALQRCRSLLRDLDGEHERLVRHDHAVALERARLELEETTVSDRLARLGVDVAAPDETGATDEDDDGADESRLQQREDELESALQRLGQTNPLALQEYEECAARHAFVEAEIDDLRRSRRDLLEIVASMDAAIEEAFAEAFTAVSERFTTLFSRVFPGGSGRLVLTEPDEEGQRGVDVEARPAGKRVGRLSLLSGGERSLVALAVLFAVYQMRPSPFYVLDEVEAALDDVNLGRFLRLLAELGARSQLLVVTHQRRTMEAADLLYGVSMGSDGVSKIVSQSLEGERRVVAA